MLKHLVSWRLSEADDATQAERARQVIAGLSSLVGVVPSIRALAVGRDVVHGDTNWDLGVVIDFDDEAGLEAYQVHPERQKVAAYIRSVVAERVTVDFVV